jgi:EAL domain-containing protein (putative c-di-GMP-specific phosphodiesterase class I)/GGDEF domain-containing protein/PAS domain-containing protein
MSSDRTFLLVIDRNPETAARINGLLRNTGIEVHVLHADNPAETERLVREFKPFLIYYLPDNQPMFPVAEAARIAEAHEVFLGVDLAQSQGQERFEEAARTAAAIGIGDEAQLPAISRRLASLGQAATIEERIRAQGEEIEQRLDLLLNSTREPVAYFHEGLHVAANRAYLELLGVDSLEDLSVVSLLEVLHQDDVDMKSMIRGFGDASFPPDGDPFELRPPAADPLTVNLTFAPVRFEDEDCVQMLVRFPGEAQDMPEAPARVEKGAAPQATSEKAAEAAIAETPDPIASADTDTDPMTGMLWRAPFLSRLNHRLAHQDEGLGAAVYFLVADKAAEQLENLGLQDLDRYVQATANEILSCLEKEDDVCRVSDSAYAFFVARKDKSTLKRIGEKLRASIEHQGLEPSDGPKPATCSIGVVLLDHQHYDPENVLENARSACRLAAEQGNKVVRYKPAQLAGVSEDEEAQWRERIRYALENEDFYTVQHSIMNLDGDLEGLVENRTFMHEDDGDLPGEAYLPAAERNQLASQVDRLVIPGLLQAVASGEERQILDISGNSVQDFSFPTWFQRTLQETRVPGKRIVLQWPAWAAREQTRAAQRLIDELAPLGVQFSVSGFDTDPKTLALLESLKLQYVTLDHDLTRDLQGDPTQLDRIREVIQVAEPLQVLTIASDVPTSSDLATLWRGGVKLVSGDFIQETPRVIGQ